VKKRLVTVAVVLGLIFPIPTSGNAADVDKTDNKAPILVSLQIDKSNLALNETTRIKLIIRDDKNDIGGSIYIQFQSPNDAPGSLRPYVFFTVSGKGYSNVVKENSYIEYTYSIPVKAPEWPGSYTAFQIFLLEDLNGNKSAFYLNQKCRNINDAFGQQTLAFPEVVPECNIDFTVRNLNPAEKAAADKAAADKAAADKAAADKAAADKAAADKAAADKAAADKIASEARINAAKSKYSELSLEIDLLLKKYPSKKSEIELYKKKINLFERIDQVNIPTVEVNLAGIESKLVAMKSVYSKIARTITCTKGKVTKKFTAINPKCPTGYKKK
jgi:hypothetical protein